MKVLGFNHLSVGARDLETSAQFYQTVLGMELIPTYQFGFKTRYLRCGDLQLHLFELEEGLKASLYLDRPHMKQAAVRTTAAR